MKSLTLILVSIFVSISSKAQIPSNGLKIHIPFDNSVVDISQNQLSTNTVSNVSYIQDRFGSPNSAGSFNGIDSYVKMNSALYLDFSSTKAFTAGLWFYTEKIQNSVQAEKNLIGFDSECSNFTYTHQVRNDSTAFFGVHGSAQTGNNGCWNNIEKPSNTNKWHFAVATMNQSTLNYYIDGVKIKNKTLLTSTFSFYASNLMIGAWSSRGASSVANYFTGGIDDVFLYDRVLTDQEILDIYNHTPTSTIELAQSSFNAYPNPTNNQLNLSNVPNDASIRITDSQGRLIYTGSNTSTFNTSQWNKGIYFISVTHKNSSSTKRILKR